VTTDPDLAERARKTAESVPPEDGVIVVHWPSRRTLAFRAPSKPVSEHHATLVVLDGPRRGGLLSMPDPYPEGPRVLWRGEEPVGPGVAGGTG
jgi:hypothetical protein